MAAFLALFRKEIFSLFVSPIVYGILAAWFFLNGVFFAFVLGYPAVLSDLNLFHQYLFGSGVLVWLLLPAFPPILTLRLFAEEHRIGTLEPLLSAPVSYAAVVLAKYLASCVFFLVFTAP